MIFSFLVPFKTSFKKIRPVWFDIVLFLLYAAVTGFILSHHEHWYDEAGPWLIARDADWKTFLKIVFQNYDRHPFLFYALLLPFAKLGFPYASIAILNWLIVLAAALLFLRNAPFPRIFKYLFIFSFYMSYEYITVARPYGLAILLIFFIASFYARRFERPWVYAAGVALLFSAEYLCFGFAAALTVLFICESWKTNRNDLKLAAILMTVAGVLALSSGHSLQPDHAEYGRALPFEFQNVFPAILKSLFPFNPVFGKWAVPVIVLWLIAGSALIAGFLSLLNTPRLFWILLLSYAEFFYIYTHIQVGDLRHYGFILVIMIFVLWIDETYPQTCLRRISLRKKIRGAALILIGIGLALGIRSAYFAYQLDYYLPFSGSKMMASQIKTLWKENPFLKNRVIVAKDSSTASILPYLPEKKFWNPCLGSIPPVHYALKKIIGCNEISSQTMIEMTQARFGSLDAVLFLVKNPFPFKESPEYRFYLLASANQYVFGYGQETFHLYLPESKRRA